MLKALLSGSLMLLGTLASESPATEAPALTPTGLILASRAQMRKVPAAEIPYSGYSPPLRVDLSEDMPRPGFQGVQNSCAAWASAYAVKTFQEKREQHYPLVRSGQMDLHKVFSPAFVYNQINQGRDGGATLPDALRLLSGRGAVSWAEMPYNIDNFTRQPTSSLLRQAQRFRIASYRRLNVKDQRELKAQLLAGYPIMIGAYVDQSFAHLKPGTIWQHSAGNSLGPHAMVLVGYDEGRHAFKLMNSWGPRWADQGFGWVDYRQLASVILEGYIAKDAPNNQATEIASLPHQRNGSPFGPQPPQPAPSSSATAGAGPDEFRTRTTVLPSAALSKPGNQAHKPQDQKKGDKDGTEKQNRSHENDKPSTQVSQKPVDLNNQDPSPVIEQSEEIELLKQTPVTLLHQQIEGPFLILEGQAQLAAGQSGQLAQVLVRFYTDATGKEALQSVDPIYGLPDGSAVAVGQIQSAQVSQLTWKARIPLAQLPKGHPALWLKPVLYVDHFGLASGNLVRLK